MDYEKEYREARERFAAFRDKYCTYGKLHFGDVLFDKTGTAQKDFDNIFPELAETEDERIRKGIIGIINMVSGPDCDVYLNEKKKEEYIAWLEKQKEQKPDVEICPHSVKSKSYSETGYPIEDCDYGLEIALNILEKTLGKVQGFQTDDGVREHQTAIKAVKDAKKEQKPWWNLEINPPTTKWTKEMIDEKFKELVEKYHEQKPAECIEDSVKFEEGFKTGRESGLRDGQKYVLDNAESFGLCKPAEWSDTDNIGWDEAFACVTRAEKAAKNEEELQNAVTAEKWLKEIKFKYYVHPVKPEWSEEDERRIDAICELLENTSALHPNYSHRKLIIWLKSIRPQPHWKPSEEQMDALNTASKLYELWSTTKERLELLYHDLQKLR